MCIRFIFTWFVCCVYFMLSFSPIVITRMRQWSVRKECDFSEISSVFPFTHETQAYTHTPTMGTHQDADYRSTVFGFRIVNINYNEVYKHCLFIVMYYDVQWSDYRRTFISLNSIHSHNILVHLVYSLKWLHRRK